MSSPSRVALLHVVHITTDSDIAESGVGRQARLTPPSSLRQRHSRDGVTPPPMMVMIHHRIYTQIIQDPSRFAKSQISDNTDPDLCQVAFLSD